MDFSKVRVGVEEMLVSDSFVVDIEGFSHLRERETPNANSRTNISSNHSRKGTARGGGGDKIMNPTAAAAVQASSRACLNGVSTPEKPVVVAHEASDHVASPKIHQITIKKGSLGTPPPESKHDGKGFGFRRSSSGRFIDSRRVVVFFATLSSMGTVLLIYLTLSIAQLNGDDNGLN